MGTSKKGIHLSNCSIGNMTVMNGRATIQVNGKVIEVPNHILKKGFRQTVINNRVYFNGYEVTEKGEFKKTPSAIWHNIF